MAAGGTVFNCRMSVGQSAHMAHFISADYTVEARRYSGPLYSGRGSRGGPEMAELTYTTPTRYKAPDAPCVESVQEISVNEWMTAREGGWAKFASTI